MGHSACSLEARASRPPRSPLPPPSPKRTGARVRPGGRPSAPLRRSGAAYCHPAPTRGAGASGVAGEERGAGREGLPRGPARWAGGKLLGARGRSSARDRKGEVSRDRGRSGRSFPGAVRTLAPPGARGNFAGAASAPAPAPPREGGCEATDHPERPCSGAHCSALLARRWAPGPAQTNCERGVRAAPLAAEGPLPRAPRAPAPGEPSFEANRPLKSIGLTLAPGTYGERRKRPAFQGRKASPRGPGSLKLHLGEVVPRDWELPVPCL